MPAKGKKTSYGAGAYVALLRGINVGGRNKLAMKDLAAVFAAAGCSHVRTYIQSGNIVFRAPAGVARGLAGVVAESLAEQFALDVPVVLRSAAELRAVVEGNPLLAGGDAAAGSGVDPKALHVAFLAERPAAKRVAALEPDRSPGDAFVVEGKEVYLHLPNGVARTKLTNAYLDATLGTVSTVRNWRTVERLLGMAEDHQT